MTGTVGHCQERSRPAPTVNRQTAAMPRTGVAERITDPDDGMARKLRTTREGRRLREEREWPVNGLRWQGTARRAPRALAQLPASR